MDNMIEQMLSQHPSETLNDKKNSIKEKAESKAGTFMIMFSIFPRGLR